MAKVVWYFNLTIENECQEASLFHTRTVKRRSRKLVLLQQHSKFAVDEVQRSLSVLTTVSVVSVRIIAVAAVRIGRIAKGLDLAVEVAAGLTRWASIELFGC